MAETFQHFNEVAWKKAKVTWPGKSPVDRTPVSEPPTPLLCQAAHLLRGMTAKPTLDWAVLWEPVKPVEKSPSCSFHLWLLQVRKQASPSMGRCHGDLQNWWKPVHWEVYRCLLNQFLQNRDKQGFSGDIKHFLLKKSPFKYNSCSHEWPFLVWPHTQWSLVEVWPLH